MKFESNCTKIIDIFQNKDESIEAWKNSTTFTTFVFFALYIYIL